MGRRGASYHRRAASVIRISNTCRTLQSASSNANPKADRIGRKPIAGEAARELGESAAARAADKEKEPSLHGTAQSRSEFCTPALCTAVTLFAALPGQDKRPAVDSSVASAPHPRDL